MDLTFKKHNDGNKKRVNFRFAPCSLVTLMVLPKTFINSHFTPMFWFGCQFAPRGEQNGKTNNLDGVRGREQTSKKKKKQKHQGVKWLFLKVWSKTVKVTKPQRAKRKFTLKKDIRSKQKF
ncbi:hypothetical protein Hanom_Chr15g01361521 [Helianthus anomalus]